MDGHAQVLAVVLGENESAGGAGDVLAVLRRNGFNAGVVVGCVLGDVCRGVAGLF